jgi:hypothetical protein
MRCVGGVVAAVFLAAGCISGVGSATADEAGVADAAGEKQHFDKYLLFSGFDLWRNGASVHGGVLWSPGGLAREGFTLKLLVAGGDYGYTSTGTAFAGRYALASAMPGWRFKWGRFELTVFAGPDFQRHRISPDDPGNRMRGDNAGLRIGADAWYQPTDTFMATGSVSVSTIGPNYWVRAAVGWYVLDAAWFGPEAMALGGDRYQQVRAGVHVTAFRTRLFEWSLGLGYAHDSEKGDGGYLRTGVLARY